ncbi:BZ3500_MvSof-1268-A1-R1_Chr4-1g06807 [Microbotryum saponariae]|uniref:BZ3500_MvSof-1268-A1-R1_Chr4-1g06807 protein n=1 Tax=Microbotryum saponariae TaxID=289078 RepID=A0A2X0LHC5_9BASI|nr:BZ3500_MvSof-1268-A1-R1_Chr4-1g06807 [Microbotryum saponariae]SDA06464.1 BZ3501_MvSof-1269-A2-R1_Chr4-1g06509 [Microbotryum saponariae]
MHVASPPPFSSSIESVEEPPIDIPIWGSSFAAKFEHLIAEFGSTVEDWESACAVAPDLKQRTLDQLADKGRRVIQSFCNRCSSLGHDQVQQEPQEPQELAETVVPKTPNAQTPPADSEPSSYDHPHVALELDETPSQASAPSLLSSPQSFLDDILVDDVRTAIVPSSQDEATPVAFTSLTAALRSLSPSLTIPSIPQHAPLTLSTPQSVHSFSTITTVPSTNAETVYVLLMMKPSPKFPSRKDGREQLCPLVLVSNIPAHSQEGTARDLLVLAHEPISKEDELPTELLTVVKDSPTMITLAPDGTVVDNDAADTIVFGFPPGSIVMTRPIEEEKGIVGKSREAAAGTLDSRLASTLEGKGFIEQTPFLPTIRKLEVGSTPWWRSQICRGDVGPVQASPIYAVCNKLTLSCYPRQHGRSSSTPGYWQGNARNVRRNRILRHFATCKQGIVAPELTAFAIACLKAAGPAKKATVHRTCPTFQFSLPPFRITETDDWNPLGDQQHVLSV